MAPATTVRLSAVPPTGALVAEAKVVQENLQTSLEREVQPLLLWSRQRKPGKEAQDFDLMLCLAERGLNVRLSWVQHALSTALGLAVSNSTGLCAYFDPAHPNPSMEVALSVVPGSVVIKLEDTGCVRRLALKIEVEITILAPEAPMSIQAVYVLTGRVHGDWKGSQGECGAMTEEHHAWLTQLTAAGLREWTFRTWQSAYGRDGELTLAMYKAADD